MDPAYSSVPFTTTHGVEQPVAALKEPNIPPEAAEIPAPLILIVDDESLVRWSVAETLMGAGYHVLEAATGRDARSAIADPRQPIAAILLDLKLPDDNGLDILDEIRRVRRHCPVLVMTAYGAPEAIERILHVGAVGILPKPFDLDRLLDTVKRICPAAPPPR
jgi:DNA-binding NtrC family response regulator